MAYLPFSATFPSSIHDFSQTKNNSVSSSSWPAMPFSTLSINSSLGSSKSAFLQHGFSLQSFTASGFIFKSRSSGIYARASTEKTLYDYTVKVQSWRSTLFLFLSGINLWIIMLINLVYVEKKSKFVAEFC